MRGSRIITDMLLIPDATLAHAKVACYVCGRGGPVVDTDAVIEGEGTLALCPGCVREAAIAAGLIKPSKAASK